MEKTAFVIMLFSGTQTCTEEQWTEIFQDVFRPAFLDRGYGCERAQPSIGNLTGSIVDQLRTSRVVLADLTDRNPNVFYELGIRHSLRRGTIIVAQHPNHVPSDLRGYWFLTYGIRPSEVRAFKASISALLDQMETKPDQSDSPVSEYLEREHISISGYTQRENIRKLTALYTELTGNIADLRSAGQYVSYGCLERLLQTLYVDLGPELLKDIYELWHQLRLIDRGDKSQELVQDTISRLQAFASEISAINASLARGEFVEPPMISSMVWISPADRSSADGSLPVASGKSILSEQFIKSMSDMKRHGEVTGKMTSKQCAALISAPEPRSSNKDSKEPL
jgi:hypothetical protein